MADDRRLEVEHKNASEGAQQTRDLKRQKRKFVNRARNRLMSIQHDVNSFCRPFVAKARTITHPNFPILANERCGSWYTYPFLATNLGGDESPACSCYFKSTDGHVGTWAFSLKRLNLNVIRAVTEHNGCLIFDASASKEFPDSFSRTIPIWAATMNRIAARFRQDLDLPPLDGWDNDVHLPEFIVSNEERDQIQDILEDRVDLFYESRAIVDPVWLATTLLKPLRPYWTTPAHSCQDMTVVTAEDTDFYKVICVNCSSCQTKLSNQVVSQDFYYSSGAADDEESWARHLKPRLFWNNLHSILNEAQSCDQTDAAIDTVVSQDHKIKGEFDSQDHLDCAHALFDMIGTLQLAIGTRSVGKPPQCWDTFDVILNVTDMEYPDIDDQYHSDGRSDCRTTGFYLQLPVREGKRDRSELERWMAVGIVFVLLHAQKKRRILIHCAQGKDRSVAMAMAVVVLLCKLHLPLAWKECFWDMRIENLFNCTSSNENSYYKCSGLPECLVSMLLGKDGRDRLIDWTRQSLYPKMNDESDLATKHTLRLALLLIQHDRQKADPSRKTMQKLNRFFMSKTEL
jgi:tRNA A64-2'-O-ribosylphosphate transferase